MQILDDPGAEFAFPTEPADVGKGLEDGLLSCLFGVRLVIKDAHGGGKKASFAGLDETVEGFFASRPRLLHQFRLACSQRWIERFHSFEFPPSTGKATRRAYLRFVQFILEPLKGPFVLVSDAKPLEKTQLFRANFARVAHFL